MGALLSLNEAPAGRYRVARVKADEEIASVLKNMELQPGDVLEVLQTTKREVPPGPLLLTISGRKMVLGRGMAQLVQVQVKNDVFCLNELLPGENGQIVAVLGGEKNQKLFDRLHLQPGKTVTIEKAFQDDLLVVRAGEREIVLGEGEAAKVWVKQGDTLTQLNFLKPGETAEVADVLGGNLVVEDLKQKGVAPGAKITFLRQEGSHDVSVTSRQVVGVVHKGREFYLCPEVASAIFLEKM